MPRSGMGRVVPVPGVPRVVPGVGGDRGHPKKTHPGLTGREGWGSPMEWGPRLSLPCFGVPRCLSVASPAGDVAASPGAPGLGRARGAGNGRGKQEMPEVLMPGNAPQNPGKNPS